MKNILVDTNCLLDGFELNKDYKYILLSHVNRELDKHKIHGDNELKFKTRRAVRFIEENIEHFKFDIKDYHVKFSDGFDDDYTDNKIIQSCLDNGYSLMTNDLLLKQKAKMYGIEVVESSINYKDDGYKGYAKVNLDDHSLSFFYENLSANTYDLITNQYLVISDSKGNHIDTYRWNGQTHVKTKGFPKSKFKVKNELQECAIDLLLNRDIPIKIIAGNFGSGKTYISVKAALYHVLEKGNQSKIMMVRNPIGSGKQIGYLKGSKEEKTDGFFKPIIQHLEGGEQEAWHLEQRGILLREIPWYMKGLSIEDTIIICDEAEDLDVKLIRLIGTRLADNSSIIFAGDYKQVEDEYRNNNGLLHAIEMLKGDPLVGIIVLDEDVRSAASKVFARLE